MKTQLTPYKIETSSEPMPPLVKAFTEGQFKEKIDDYSVEIIRDRSDTGYGMSYMNRLILTKAKETVRDSGMLTYRDGRPGYPTEPMYCYRRAGFLLHENIIYFGIEDGEGRVSIFDLPSWIQVAWFDVSQAKRDSGNGSIDPTSLSDLRRHFKDVYNRGEHYPWTIGSEIVCELGKGFMAFHNGRSGLGGEVWNKCVVVVIHENKPYISNPVGIPLSGDNWCLSHLMSCEIEGSKFKCGFVCCRHDSWRFNFTPKVVEFELQLP